MTVIPDSDIKESISSAVGKLIHEGRIRLDWDQSSVYSVYILQVDDDVWRCKKCSRNLGEDFRDNSAFYVGMTKKPRAERIQEHRESYRHHQSGMSSAAQNKEFWTRGAKMTREHGFETAEEIEPLDLDGESLDGRLRKDDAKLLEQIVIPTALRALGFAAYAGAAEEFVAISKAK
jgi:hypothetical protein